MAGYRQTSPAHATPPAPTVSAPSQRSLPNGPCNYRDLAHGGTCGCDQFWDKCSAEVHSGSEEKRERNEQSTWCVCGHHACFHLKGARPAPERLLPLGVGAQSHTHAHAHAHVKCDGRCRSQSGSQCIVHRVAKTIEQEHPQSGGHIGASRRLKPSYALSSQRHLRQNDSQSNRPRLVEQNHDQPSLSAASSMPRVPSVCFLSHDRRTGVEAQTRIVGAESDQLRAGMTGLGLSLMTFGDTGNANDRPQSVGSTVPDDMNRLPTGSFSEPELPSTRANSIPEENAQGDSIARNVLDQILEYNRNPQLDISADTIPNTYNPEEFILSATEVATPSLAGTPDLGQADQAVHETKKLVETLARLTSNSEAGGCHEAATSTSEQPRLMVPSPALGTSQEQLQRVLRSASPQALQKLVSYLNPLHNLLNSIPHVANTMRDLSNRLDHMENNSFNYIQPEDVHQQFELYDGRLLELEHRMDDHDRVHQAIDADQSSNSQRRRRFAAVTDSFGSHHSLQSTTSSALIVAAIDRKEFEVEFEGIKDRLDVLEAAAVPTSMNPWQVEVILLPWGRELRGIWFNIDEPMHDPTKGVTQDSEDWTQRAKSVQQTGQSTLILGPPGLEKTNGSSVHSKGSFPQSDAESGWSSQAISDWAAGDLDELLSPKACGSNNLVYKRLQSRGFVRDVTLKGSSSREIQSTLSTAFVDIMNYYNEDDEHSTLDAYPGLRAPFIPLRKVIKESRLRFVTKAELASSALWDAHFLASGIMMKVSGGKRRLYVTHREAYLQPSEDNVHEWTWPQIRQLPRYQSDPNSQMEGNDDHCQPKVPEADAKEACWAFFEAYDPPASSNSSFNSHHSVQIVMRPADRQWRRSITPSSILRNKQLHPISPLSENHPRRLSHTRNRTMSSSLIEQATQGSSKRRLNSSPVKPSSAPHVASRVPSVPIIRPKRRRVANSSSPKPQVEPPQDAQVTIWNNTPRRSREPPSPFFSSQPQLARTSSDVTNRSERSAAIIGKGTPFAYATPHSGPMNGRERAFSGSGNEPGDTEVDDDGEFEDDGEKSWRGVNDTNGEDSDAQVDAEEDEQESTSSADDSGFGSEDEDDDDDLGPAFDDEDGDEIFDTLLGVLED
ncbi:hypothetical protein P154DRAFT_518161 [Amniculicola lignicola CBS 123094]|uniref:Uncharacterized protein n=1 Tax=Amniculicola lignicola CBS 123094 TaxID=1392246 RepID=A0A6A5X2N0_9PLEO|nr:hypothetical protein P154DRAFT_518161 [Amniculicola lignicola CBS 123094]